MVSNRKNLAGILRLGWESKFDGERPVGKAGGVIPKLGLMFGNHQVFVQERKTPPSVSRGSDSQ